MKHGDTAVCIHCGGRIMVQLVRSAIVFWVHLSYGRTAPIHAGAAS